MAVGFPKRRPAEGAARHRRLHGGGDRGDRLRRAGGGGRRQHRAGDRAAVRHRHAAARRQEDHPRTTRQRLTPIERAGDYAQAMMDLGAAICTPKKPACSLCPLAEPCVARADGRQEDYPVKAQKAERPTRRGAAFVAVRADGAVLLRRRGDSGLLGGMTEVPGTVWGRRLRTPSAADAPFPADWSDAGTVVHVFTHFRLELTVYCAHVGQVKKAPAGCWWAPARVYRRRSLAERHEEGDRGGAPRAQPESALRERNQACRLRSRPGAHRLRHGGALPPACPRRRRAAALLRRSAAFTHGTSSRIAGGAGARRKSC